MGVVAMESFDGMSITEFLRKWTVPNDANYFYIGSYGRSGTNGLRISRASYNRQAYLNFSPSYDTLYVGCYLKYANISVTAPILLFYEGSTLHVDIRIQGNTGKIYATRN